MTLAFTIENEESSAVPWSMYNRDGQRKYLTRAETSCFVRTAKKSSPSVQGFCLILAATGCRISEALALSARNLDFEAGTIVIECLKKRGKRVFRAVPIEKSLLARLKRWLDSGALQHDRLFPWSRMTGYRRICEVMGAAGIRGSYASPKGLRHAFGINAIQSGVPLNMVQRWLGHADIKTTAIYTSATGDEERLIARRMWDKSDAVPQPHPIAPEDCDDTCDRQYDDQAHPSTRAAQDHLRSAGQTSRDVPLPTVNLAFCGKGRRTVCTLGHFWLNCSKLFPAVSDSWTEPSSKAAIRLRQSPASPASRPTSA